jgi:ribonuclease HII
MGCTVRPKFDLRLLPPSPTLDIEQELWQRKFYAIAGLDEAGRGALAGPLYAAAVILPKDSSAQLLAVLAGVRDSKQLTANKREAAASVIKLTAVAWGIGVTSAAEIDEIGMAKAGRLVFERALASLKPAPDYLLIDYFNLPSLKIPQTALVKGDARSLSIACASILAKTARDAAMRELDQTFPAYSFALNKGYGTSTHRQALLEHGTCPEHRQSFQLFKLQEELF